jgi:RNA polymerase sporulation-specific sigma factor
MLRKIITFIKSLFYRKGIYYINGSDVLPPPLSAQEEHDLLWSEISPEEKRGILIERNLRLVVFISKKFENTGVNIEELISIGTIGLIKAIDTYQPEKNIKLATYAARCIENEILMFIRKNNARREISFDEPLNVDWDGNELLLSDILGSPPDAVSQELEEREERELLRRAVSHLSERERTIIELRYGLNGGDDLTQKEVADLLGISQSYISRLEKKIIRALRREMTEKI